jgi:hypothetical protein
VLFSKKGLDMKILIQKVFAVLSLFVLISCGNKGGGIRPGATGDEGEMVIILDGETWNNNELADSLIGFFERDISGFPQSEKKYKVYKLTWSQMSQIFQIHQNILWIKFDKTYDQETFGLKNNLWANGQTVVQCKARSYKDFLNFFEENKYYIEKKFVDADFERVKTRLAKIKDSKLEAVIENSLGINITIPDGYYEAINSDTLVYFKHEAIRTSSGQSKKILRGVWAYSIPYMSSNMYETSNIIKLRNEVTAKIMQGIREENTMIVEPRVEPDRFEENWNGELAVIHRGLWRVDNEFKGGPFVNVITFDRKNRRILMLDAFVYAPSFDKKEYVMQVEAIIRSMQVL